MTEKAKKAFDFLKKDKEALEKFSKVNTIQGALDLAKEYHFDITEEDLGITPEKKEILESKKKMDMKELEKVSGSGGGCGCALFGYGAGKNEYGNFACGCEVAGGGGYEWDSLENLDRGCCVCYMGGAGATNESGC